MDFHLRDGRNVVWQVILIVTTWGYLCGLQIDNDGLWCQPDSSRHALNGLFWKDFLQTLPASPQAYALSYFARYPAINPVSYPPFFYLLEGALFATFGPSPFIAKGTVLSFTLLGALYTMAWLRRFVAEEAGFWRGRTAVARDRRMVARHHVECARVCAYMGGAVSYAMLDRLAEVTPHLHGCGFQYACRPHLFPGSDRGPDHRGMARGGWVRPALGCSPDACDLRGMRSRVAAKPDRRDLVGTHACRDVHPRRRPFFALVPPGFTTQWLHRPCSGCQHSAWLPPGSSRAAPFAAGGSRR